MVFISVRDLRSRSSEIWKRIQKEKDLVVTSNGRPIAILTGVTSDSFEQSLNAIRRSRAIQATESMQLAAAKAGLDKLTGDEIGQEIHSVRQSRRK